MRKIGHELVKVSEHDRDMIEFNPLEVQFGKIVLKGLERYSEGQIMKVRMERD